MLVLTIGEKKRINFPGLNAFIKVIKVQGGKVRLGFEFPEEVKILREGLEEQNDE